MKLFSASGVWKKTLNIFLIKQSTQTMTNHDRKVFNFLTRNPILVLEIFEIWASSIRQYNDRTNTDVH